MVTHDEKNLIERIIALFPLASKDETRHHLNCVIIEGDTERRQLFLKVTDNHRLVKETLQNESHLCELINGEQYGVFAEHIPVLKAMLKQNKYHLPILVERVDSTHIKLSAFGLSITLEMQQSYPKAFDQLIPDKKDDDFEIAFNANYLFEISKALRDSNKETMIKLRIKDKSSPFFVSTKSGREAILMPCRFE